MRLLVGGPADNGAWLRGIDLVAQDVAHRRREPMPAALGGYAVRVQIRGNLGQAGMKVWPRELGKDSPHYCRLIFIDHQPAALDLVPKWNPRHFSPYCPA